MNTPENHRSESSPPSIDYKELMAQSQSPEQPEQNESSKPPYTPQEIAKLSFESFRFSQGNQKTQCLLIEYIVLHERDRLTTEAINDSMPQLADWLRKYIQNPAGHAKVAGVEGAISQEMHLMHRRWEYPMKDSGRQRSSSEHSTSRPSSRYLSQLVYYGMLGHSTDSEVYDRMFRDVTAIIQRKWQDRIYDDMLEAPIGKISDLVKKSAQVHLEHYPDDAGKLPAEWRQLLSGQQS